MYKFVFIMLYFSTLEHLEDLRRRADAVAGDPADPLDESRAESPGNHPPRCCRHERRRAGMR